MLETSFKNFQSISNGLLNLQTGGFATKELSTLIEEVSDNLEKLPKVSR